MAELTLQQAIIYSEVGAALDEEGYGDLLKGQPVDVRDALAQMLLDAAQMVERAERLQQRLNEARALGAPARGADDQD